ncbi:SusD/RagB family nutrient-binding outer membrane lipoprotein [Gramella sp. KN1008]|uniref:SusD/RagB family nutrient-binding outer membrane lipoprotein n=1 Tax=Gramella sp. KN1008 TaxID=2529298 RepID=UPI00103F90A0|nr:SusD/RagB family nutrient-binding outer membrane lipoprotein [Gramella sp. KN1008]TBW25876.1 SusD/RagB family nutrient-binding outer membrane lipoprotein [Gramella sp. KN1008]
MKNKLRLFKVLFLFAVITGCETVDLDLQDSPNDLTLDQSDPDYLLNGIQLEFENIFWRFNEPDLEMVRMENLRGTYAANNDESTFQQFSGIPSPYVRTYRLMKNTDALASLKENDPSLAHHLAIAQVLEAWSMVMMVDHFGEVPYDEANLPNEFPHPAVDSGEEIYEAAFAVLDEAVSNFQQSVASPDKPQNDLFYGGDEDLWMKAINSLKLKMHITTRLVNPTESASAIDAIIAGGNYIDDLSEDFTFKYSSAVAPADSRHPLYRQNYTASLADAYMSNDFINLIKNTKEVDDPRLRYYIYRQTGDEPSGDFLPCDGRVRYNYCYTGDLYWGRDHKDLEGIPNDQAERSTYGIYPAGGAYDDGDVNDPSTFQNVVQNPGLNGEGIQPIWMASFSSFTLAEAALTIGVTGTPEEYLEDGIRKSFDQVERLSGIPMDSDEKEAYIAAVLESYENAGTEEEKLEIIMTEYYLAMFGNGVEAYNTYRRTGYPSYPKGVESPDEPFANIYLYPIDATSANRNISQRSRDERVFWDTLSADLN